MATSEAAARTALDTLGLSRPPCVLIVNLPTATGQSTASGYVPAIRDRYARQDAVQTGTPTAI